MKSRLNEIRARLTEIKPEIATLAYIDGVLPEAEEARFQGLVTEWDALTAEAAPLEERQSRIDAITSTVVAGQIRMESGDGSAAPAVQRQESPFDILESRGIGMSDGALRSGLVSANLKAVEGMITEASEQRQFESVLKRHGSDARWAAGILARSRPAYLSAWSKMVTGRSHELDAEERSAIAVGTSTSGGYLVPTMLDPTLITSYNLSLNEIRQASRVVTLTEGNVWNGVTAGAVTASWDGELVEVSDDTPAFGGKAIPVRKAQAFVQASFEAFEDISGLEADVRMLFADAKDNLEGTAFAMGNGTTAPRGIFTALDANTNVEITSTTAAAIGEVDLAAMYTALGNRFRSNARWLMNPTYALAIKRLGSAVSSSYSGDLRDGPTGTIFDKPVIQSDDAPATQTTNVRDNEVVLGDFRNYVIVDKPGSFAIEFIPNMFNTANNLPDGRRGWLAHWRTGADSVNDLAFRLLQDKTTT